MTEQMQETDLLFSLWARDLSLTISSFPYHLLQIYYFQGGILCTLKRKAV